jgi:hypothetical protein
MDRRQFLQATAGIFAAAGVTAAEAAGILDEYDKIQPPEFDDELDSEPWISWTGRFGGEPGEIQLLGDPLRFTELERMKLFIVPTRKTAKLNTPLRSLQPVGRMFPVTGKYHSFENISHFVPRHAQITWTEADFCLRTDRLLGNFVMFGSDDPLPLLRVHWGKQVNPKDDVTLCWNREGILSISI